MLKQLRKKKIRPIELPESNAASITCGGCGHLREASATNPDWQCPCCGKAYAKVNVTEKEHARRRRAEIRAEMEAQRETKKVQQRTLGGFYAGGITFLSGLGSACSGAAANPWVQAAGLLIALGAAAYGLHYYFS